MLAGAVRVAGYVIADIYDSTFYNNTSRMEGLLDISSDLVSNGQAFGSKLTVDNCSFENPWTDGFNVLTWFIWNINTFYTYFVITIYFLFFYKFFLLLQQIYTSGKLFSSIGKEKTKFSNTRVKYFKYGNLFSSEISEVELTNCTFSDMSLDLPLISILNENGNINYKNIIIFIVNYINKYFY